MFIVAKVKVIIYDINDYKCIMFIVVKMKVIPKSSCIEQPVSHGYDPNRRHMVCRCGVG